MLRFYNIFHDTTLWYLYKIFGGLLLLARHKYQGRLVVENR